jgi:uncharacterized protein YndB with AHSA1/START domain
VPATKSQTGRGVSDEKVRAETGRTWAEWEAELDARGAADLSHRKIVALLAEGLVASSWWRQSITVDYEKRKGRRTLGQTADGGFQIGVRRTLPMAQDDAWRLVTSPEGLRAWLGEAPGLSLEEGAAYTAGDGSTGEVRVSTPGSHVRITRRQPGWARASTVQVRVIPAGERSTISFHEERLPAAADREERRRHYQAALDVLERQAGGSG